MKTETQKQETGGSLDVAAGFGVWQPIETGPLDWTTVNLYSEKTGEVFCGYYSPEDVGAGRWIAHYTWDEDSEQTVSHWQPLPAPPNH